jgi:hypothetical protein
VAGALLLALAAQAAPAQEPAAQEQPAWLVSLRRAEIVSFGAFPFALFAASFGVDTYRFFAHEGNTRYAPWPFNMGGVAQKTDHELGVTVAVATGISLAVALADFLIVRHKRRAQAELPPNQPGETPLPVRGPLPETLR